MVLSHMANCMASRALACRTILKSVEITYKQALTILHKKSETYHHCNDLLSRVLVVNVLVFEILN